MVLPLVVMDEEKYLLNASDIITGSLPRAYDRRDFCIMQRVTSS